MGFVLNSLQIPFVKKINQWCNDHGIHLTGHMDQEEVPNPIPITGDLMKVFEHQDIPGVDDIFIFGDLILVIR